MKENKNYYYSEMLKLATHSVSKATHWLRPLMYPDFTDVYLEYKGDLRYNPITKEGDMFICISTPKHSRKCGSLKFSIENDIINYGVSHNKAHEAPITPEIMAELDLCHRIKINP